MFITGGFKSNDFGSAHSARVSGALFVTVHFAQVPSSRAKARQRAFVEIFDCPGAGTDPGGYTPGSLHQCQKKWVAGKGVRKNMKTKERIFALANEGFAIR